MLTILYTVAVLAAASAAAAYVVLRAIRARFRLRDQAAYLLDQFRFLKTEIGMEPEWAVETADEYHELLEQIEFSPYVDDDDRYPLRDMLEAEFYEPSIERRPLAAHTVARKLSPTEESG